MLHSAAYVIMHTFREKALAGTSLANAQFDTIRLKLLKIGAEVCELKTKLHFILPASCPVKDILVTIVRNIALVTYHCSCEPNIQFFGTLKGVLCLSMPKTRIN